MPSIVLRSVLCRSILLFAFCPSKLSVDAMCWDPAKCCSSSPFSEVGESFGAQFCTFFLPPLPSRSLQKEVTSALNDFGLLLQFFKEGCSPTLLQNSGNMTSSPVCGAFGDSIPNPCRLSGIRKRVASAHLVNCLMGKLLPSK